MCTIPLICPYAEFTEIRTYSSLLVPPPAFLQLPATTLSALPLTCPLIVQGNTNSSLLPPSLPPPLSTPQVYQLLPLTLFLVFSPTPTFLPIIPYRSLQYYYTSPLWSKSLPTLPQRIIAASSSCYPHLSQSCSTYCFSSSMTIL